MNLDVGPGGGVYNWRPRAEICVTMDAPTFKVKEHVVKADVLHLPFKDKQFDVVFAYNLLEHVSKPYDSLREMRRVGFTVKLRQDTMFNFANYATPEHLWFQLPGLKFLPYPRTRVGIAFSRFLRIALTQSLPRFRWHYLIEKFFIRYFFPPRQQYDVELRNLI